jgi:hypothetical protein
MTEADYEYLFRALSEARSRATEIAVGVRSRVGPDHRIAELGDAAIAQIESVLREVRRAATGDSSASPAAPPDTATEQVTPVSTASDAGASVASGLAGLLANVTERNPEHWFRGFLGDLVAQSHSGEEITFEVVEQLLKSRKEVFLKELETARRMYLTYPHLFAEPRRGGRPA